MTRMIAPGMVPAELKGSAQDEALKRHLLHVVRGAKKDHGPHVAELLGAYIARMQGETGWSFTGCVVRLIEEWGSENAR